MRDQIALAALFLIPCLLLYFSYCGSKEEELSTIEEIPFEDLVLEDLVLEEEPPTLRFLSEVRITMKDLSGDLILFLTEEGKLAMIPEPITIPTPEPKPEPEPEPVATPSFLPPLTVHPLSCLWEGRQSYYPDRSPCCVVLESWK